MTALVSIFTNDTFAQIQDSTYWKAYLNKEAFEQIKSSENTKIDGFKPGYYILQHTLKQERDLINSEEIELSRQLNNAYSIIYIKASYIYNRLKINHIIGPANNRWKFTKKHVNSIENSLFNSFIINVRNFEKCKETWLDSKYIEIIEEYKKTNTFRVIIKDDNFLKSLVTNDDVIFINPSYGTPKDETSVIDLNLSVNKVSYNHDKYPNFIGVGQHVSIKEQGMDLTDIDLLGRVQNTNTETQSRHATEMGTILAGAGNTSPKSKGVAYGAELFSSSYDNIFPDDLEYFSSRGIYLQNHSYGTQLENFYGAEAEAYDLFSHNNPEILHIFSAGNNGSASDTVYTYAGTTNYANLTGNFKMAKNIITVASVDTTYKPDPYVSRGPAYDGRIKPEISAYSTFGSSSASALVSGIATTLQEHYVSEYDAIPEASLIKGILLNSADEAGPEGIDFKSGFGSVNSKRAVEVIKNQSFTSDEMPPDDEKTFVLNMPENARNLKLMLIWNDPAATVNADKALVNDLDLSLEFGGETWLPWVLNSYPHNDSLALPAKRMEDHLNNMEQITISKPESGDYSIKVNSIHALSSQRFHLIYQWDYESSFEWVYPTASDNMPAYDQLSYFRWESTFTDNGTLEISYDNGANWSIIDNQVDLKKGFYQWTPPKVNTLAQARIVTTEASFTSPTFTISRPIEAQVGFNCADSVLLIWNNQSGVERYNIYTLGEQYLETIATTSDTAFMFSKSDYDQNLFSIRPVLSNEYEGAQNAVFDYRIQGVDCYLGSFLALEDQQNELVNLTLSIGTTYNVKEITFQRADGSEFTNISTLSPDGTTISYTDSNPIQGLSRYRAIITLNSGLEVMSEEALVYFLSDQPVLIFPNPVQEQQAISVYTKYNPGDKYILRLYNTQGQQVFATTLLSEREFVPLDGIQKGLYIYTISGDNINYKSKLVIE
ncbi:S8 family serine peptidase [Fulvivirga ligni]|uniref:S8 family serine peptidase n=1 Tax=Fulvivirga ligni TaxID=2904246 RepID=UPI001F1CD8F0|nr:S8 family serine peptidase [Fulvivirga ligni]UII23563.1 S8 family peptidase [Fulvivirga ligni]